MSMGKNKLEFGLKVSEAELFVLGISSKLMLLLLLLMVSREVLEDLSLLSC